MNGEDDVNKGTVVVDDEKSHPQVLHALGDIQVIYGWFEVFVGVGVKRGMIVDEDIPLETAMEVVGGGKLVAVADDLDGGDHAVFIDKATKGNLVFLVLFDVVLDLGYRFWGKVPGGFVYHGVRASSKPVPGGYLEPLCLV